MDLNSFATQIEKINQTLETLIPENNLPHNTLFQAARYALIGPGKRIRPLLTLATVQTLGGNLSHALQPACAIELIHTYSLIHDDLPCMDNDDFRRGKPSLHRVYPEGHALLAGDFLLTHAFHVLANTPSLNAEQRLALIDILSHHAGGHGMVGGQVIDLQTSGSSIEFETLKMIHSMKTGGLITAAVEFGAVIAQTSPKHREIFREFGQHIGLAFQIIDDILDRSQDEEKEKIPSPDYVSFLGLEKAKAAALETLQAAEEKLLQLPYNTDLLKKLAHLIVNRTH